MIPVLLPRLSALAIVAMVVAFIFHEFSVDQFLHSLEDSTVNSTFLSDQLVVLICLGSTFVLLFCTLRQQHRILARYPDVKDRRPRFHGGALSFFFSPTAGHVWFSLVFPWLALMLVDSWFLHGQIINPTNGSPLPWTLNALFVVLLCLPLLCFQQLERELERLRQSHRLDQDRQIIRDRIAAIRERQRDSGGAFPNVIKP